MFKKTKNKFVAGIASLLIIGGVISQPISAQEEADETAIDISFTFKNDYILRGNSFANGYKKSASSFATLLYFQPDIYFQLKHGWWFDIWASVQLGNKSYFFGDDGRGLSGTNRPHDYFDELDYAFGYSDSSRIGDVSVGFLVYAYPNPLYAIESDLDLSFSYASPVAPELSFYWLHSLRFNGSINNGRNYFAVKFNKDWDIGNDTSFGLSLALGYHMLRPVTEDGRTTIRQGFSHLDIGISLSKDFFSWSLTAIDRHNLTLTGQGETSEYIDNAISNDALGLEGDDRVTQQNPRLIWLTALSFGFGF